MRGRRKNYFMGWIKMKVEAHKLCRGKTTTTTWEITEIPGIAFTCWLTPPTPPTHHLTSRRVESQGGRMEEGIYLLHWSINYFTNYNYLLFNRTSLIDGWNGKTAVLPFQMASWCISDCTGNWKSFPNRLLDCRLVGKWEAQSSNSFLTSFNDSSPTYLLITRTLQLNRLPLQPLPWTIAICIPMVRHVQRKRVEGAS